MAKDILTGFGTRVGTPQNERATTTQTKNAAGGYVFAVTPLERLRRFLVLGTDAGTYYTKPRKLTKANVENLLKLVSTDHKAAVDTVVDVSLRGAAPRQNPTLFTLAALASIGTVEERAYALAQLNKVARTGTHLFEFVGYVEQFRGWGPALKRAVGGWYTGRTADKLAYQAVKYRQRNGWSHRDLLRLAHPQSGDPGTMSTLKWIATAATDENTPKLIEGFLKLRETENVTEVAKLVRQYGLTWEMLPDYALSSTDTWDALLDVGIPQTALMRQLPRLTRLGMLSPLGGRTGEVAARLVDMERLRAGRVHPVNVLIAQRTYASGQGTGSVWTPTTAIMDALDMAFYAAFGAIEPTGQRYMLALDVSGSMGTKIIDQAASKPGREKFFPISAREASAALALVTMATEKNTTTVGFTAGHNEWGFTATHNGWGMSKRNTPQVFPGLTSLAISPRQRLDDAVAAVSRLPFGDTDASLPIRYATENEIAVDTFIVYTDNETWAGPVHVHQSLEAYRRKTGIPAKLIVVGMTATECTIADPTDALSMNVAGFDAGLPQFISEFSRGL